MGLWIPIILMCGGPYIESCKVISGQELINTKEQCFRVSREKASKAVAYPQVYKALPLCQEIPSKILPEDSPTKKIDL